MPNRVVKLSVLIFALYSAPLNAFGADKPAEGTRVLEDVVVSATRTLTSVSKLGSSVTVITSEEIEDRQQTQVIDVLRSVPGLSVVQTGPKGGTVSIFMRGTENRHTLVLVDGVEFRDATQTGANADLRNLTTDNIERIEVVKGPQSVLYGSDAIGGVINIITRKGQKKPSGYVSVEAGSYSARRGVAGGSFGNDFLTTSFTVSGTETDGFSVAREEDGNSENDGYENKSAGLKINANPSQILDLNFNLHLSRSEQDSDGFGYDKDGDSKSLIDNLDTLDTDETTGRLEGVFHFLENRWQMAVGGSYSRVEREMYLQFDNEYDFKGTIRKFDMQNTFFVNEQNTIVAGVETEKETYEDNSLEKRVTNNAVYLQEQFAAGNFAAAVGIRYDDHDAFGGITTWRVAPTYTISATGTQIKGSVGTGFKAPSLYQLYGPDIDYGDWGYYVVGNENLEPEESTGYDIGIEQPLLDRQLVIAVFWFWNDIDDLIDYNNADNLIGYYNIPGVQTQGIESTISWYPCDYFNMQLGYTYTDTEDDNGDRLDRRPLHKGTADLNFYPVKNLQVNLNAVYVSQRYDDDEELDAYTLVNLAASYQVCKTVKVFGRIENFFDEEYEEVDGYGTADLSAYAGVKLNF